MSVNYAKQNWSILYFVYVTSQPDNITCLYLHKVYIYSTPLGQAGCNDTKSIFKQSKAGLNLDPPQTDYPTMAKESSLPICP